MANKEYQALSLQPTGSMTKIRAEQIRSEDGLGSLAIDLEALRGQVKDIIGAADYKEAITGEYAKVQIVDLADHLDASQGASALSIKKAANVVGSFAVNTDKLTVAAATGNTAIAGTLGVAGLASLDGGIAVDGSKFTVADATGNVKTEGTLEVDGEATLNSAIVEDLTPTRVVYAGAGSALVDHAEMTFAAGVLTVSSSLFSKDVSIAGDLTVAGNFDVNGTVTYIDTTNLLVKDARVVISSGSVTNGAGIYVGDESVGAPKVFWDTIASKWIASSKLSSGDLQATNLSSAPISVGAFGDLQEMDYSTWVLGTANQLIVSRSGTDFHGVTLSLPQNIDTAANVSFAGVTAYLSGSGLTSGKLLKASAGGLVVDASIDDFVNVSTGMTESLVGNVLTLSIGQSVDTSATVQFGKMFLDGAGASDAFIDSDGSDMLVLGYRNAAGTGAVSLPVAESGNYTLSGFTATSIVGALNELKSTASASSKKAIHTVGASGFAADAPMQASLSSNFLDELTAANAMIFVNGQLMIDDSDFTLDEVAKTLSFKFALYENDVVVVQKA